MGKCFLLRHANWEHIAYTVPAKEFDLSQKKNVEKSIMLDFHWDYGKKSKKVSAPKRFDINIFFYHKINCYKSESNDIKY